MKIRINEYGLLFINRGFSFKEQICPYALDNDNCGEWCPLFGEPIKVNLTENLNCIMLSLCKKTLDCKPEDFIDERKNKDKDTF